MRGYFGIGVENISKSMNAGSLFRTAQAIGASFIFPVSADCSRRRGKAHDTSESIGSAPYHAWPDVEAMALPRGHVVKIPTKFAVNLAIAGAVVMSDRMIGLGRFPGRPVAAGRASLLRRPHRHGGSGGAPSRIDEQGRLGRERR